MKEKMILNIGSGKDDYGDVRMDIVKYPHVTIVGNIEEPLPFKDNEFDEVYCRNVFEHLGNPMSVLLEMKRVCKNKGIIKINTDNAGFILYHYNFALSPHGDYSQDEELNQYDLHFMLFQPEHIRNFFLRSGLKLIDIHFEYIDEIERKRLGYIAKFKKYLVWLLLPERLGSPKILATGKVIK